MNTIRLQAVDMHTAGEPVRIVEQGYPTLEGRTLLEKRRDALTRFDHLRTTLMLEPRGHAGMYGVIPTEACDPEADFAVLFAHQEGYSTMCGHATIAIGRWAIDTGRATLIDGRAAFKLEAPCGVIAVEVTQAGEDVPLVCFESVESFASHLDAEVDVPGFGRFRFDIAFGGAYYVILPASRIGLSLMETPLDRLAAAGAAITDAVRKAIPITHPGEADLGFLYGTILTDDVALGDPRGQASYNLCIFAEGQIDRSPTGSGVTARIALAAARGEMRVGQSCEIRGVSGEGFVGTLSRTRAGPDGAISRVKVAGRSFYSSRCEFFAEEADPFGAGFVLPATFGDLLLPADSRFADKGRPRP
jgi:proline racemase